ncbi:Protein of unknown function [Chryseobacterium sp. RU37D]|uniref:DUF3302 domain-containing protein n=1 Tax=Chryseobacterium sp. RU37D TaxID=1907397 RepID=UPI000953E7D3|nr:DUF3302 domain-containing protein [Chryseobacterium sp. RU37D]SIQ98912.1 Protein of unknown function [Chryseobacterium sp. RU37D]
MKKKICLITLFFSHYLLANEGGGFEDKFADFISWLVLVLLPIGGAYLFWKAHIYPEVVAERNNHPQLGAIKAMCLLSLFVGGLLWPIALIWANYKYPKKDFEPSNKIKVDGEGTESNIITENHHKC